MAIEIEGKVIHVEKIIKGATKIAYISRPMKMLNLTRESDILKHAPLAKGNIYSFTCIPGTLALVKIKDVKLKRFKSMSLNDLEKMGYQVIKDNLEHRLRQLYSDLEIEVEEDDNPYVFLYDIEPTSKRR
jgi:hypothetical protein